MSTVLTDKQTLRNLSRNLRSLLESREMSQADLARASGEVEMQISRYVRGIQMPGAGVLSRLADALDVRADDLIREKNLVEAG